MHRDIKPENILVDIDEKTNSVRKINLIDFGFSCFISSK